MSEEWDKYVEAVKKSFVEAAEEFADDEQVKEFFKEQAILYGKTFYYAEVATSPTEKKQHEDDLATILAQNKSEIRRLALAADNLVRAKLEGVLSGVGNLILNLVKGGVGS